MENELAEDGIETVEMEELESEHRIEMENLDEDLIEHGKESGQDRDLYSDLYSNDTDAGIELGQKRDTQNGKQSDEPAGDSSANENRMGPVKETIFSVYTDKHGEKNREGGQTTPTTSVRCACTNHCISYKAAVFTKIILALHILWSKAKTIVCTVDADISCNP